LDSERRDPVHDDRDLWGNQRGSDDFQRFFGPIAHYQRRPVSQGIDDFLPQVPDRYSLREASSIQVGLGKIRQAPAAGRKFAHLLMFIAVAT